MSTWNVTYPLPKPTDYARLFPRGAAFATSLPHTYATLIIDPTPYVIVGFKRGLDEHERRRADQRLEEVRRAAAEAAGIRLTDTVPKLALASPSARPEASLAFCSRMFPPDSIPSSGIGAVGGASSSCWHPRIATGGLLALALAIAHPDSVPAALLGGETPGRLTVDTPAGLRVLEYVKGPEGQDAVRLNVGAVDIEGL